VSRVTRFLVDVDADWTVTVTCPERPGWELAPKRMGRVTDAKGRSFPRPAAALHEPGEAHDGGPATVSDIGGAYDQIVNRRGEIKRFGHYLFDALIGPERWSEIQRLATGLGGGTIELALSWSPADADLHRINWELLHADDRFLAGGAAGMHVAISRVVPAKDGPAPASGAGSAHSPRQLRSPPRVLFAIGTKLTDPNIRPAAELVGLLRRIDGTGGSIRYRVLEHASRTTLGAMIADFRPDVVHLICHGGFHRGRPYLELRSDEADGDPRCFAESLLNLLQVDGELPPIVVLSACYTASAAGVLSYLGQDVSATAAEDRVRLGGAHETAPLATRLILGGVPIVLGMAGRVADMTCRLFTRQFGAAIVNGESLVVATAQARQATFAEGRDPVTTVDWAFPAIFMDSRVPDDYVPLPRRADRFGPRVADWIKAYNVSENPVFCGREEFIAAFHDLFAKPGPRAPRHQVLAAYVKTTAPGYGRSRLLKELAVRSLREGHIPVLLTFSGSRSEPPATLPQLAQAFSAEIDRIRYEIFELSQSAAKYLPILQESPAEAVSPSVDADELVRMYRRDGGVSLKVLRRFLRQELAALLDDVRAEVDFFRNAQGQVVVLLDDVDRYGEVVEPLFAQPDGLINEFGMGTRTHPVPTVLAFSLDHPTSGAILRGISDGPGHPSVRPMELRAFDDPEHILACEMVLLHPYSENILRGVSGKAWAFNDAVDEEIRERWEGRFIDRLQGLPIGFSSPTFYATAQDANDYQFVILADENDWLDKVLRRAAR
jgi:hypothetical protein